MDRPLNLVENENRRPPVMMHRLFIAGLQDHLEHPKVIVLINDLVVRRSGGNGIECWIPG